jgi:hypothetical protein
VGWVAFGVFESGVGEEGVAFTGLFETVIEEG